MAPAQGRVGAALWYHTPVVITLALAAIYLFFSNRVAAAGESGGWVLRYDRRWPMVLVGLFLANCVVRNVLWLGLGVPL